MYIQYYTIHVYYIYRIKNETGFIFACFNFIAWQLQIPKEAVVEIYRNQAYMLDVYMTTLKGYRTVLQACWYLDLIKYGVQWQAFYACDPGNFNGMNFMKMGTGIFFYPSSIFTLQCFCTTCTALYLFLNDFFLCVALTLNCY